MRASYNKIQEYFSKKLLKPKKLAELLTNHSYEVENIEEVDGDYIFNIDILPNRAGDSSSDGGVAKEISIILNTTLKENPFSGKLSKSKISISVSDINKLLGSNISQKEAENIFKRLGFNYEVNGEDFIVNPPIERMDLKVKADLIEEVGRIYGYENIEAKLPEKMERESKINKKLYYTSKIRQFLADRGFSEVYTYSFRDKGEVEIEKPFASDKNFLRADLHAGLSNSLRQNIKNMPLLDCDDIKIFEIGNIFLKNKEHTSLALGGDLKYIGEVINELSKILGVEIIGDMKENIFETNFDELIGKLASPLNSYKKEEIEKDIIYKPIAAYPFMLRDIAIWVPKNKTSEDIFNVIKKSAGELLINIKLFDKFIKDDKISYAFNLVFQSQEKTLSDKEVNKIMDKITGALNSNSRWEVR